MVRIALLFAFVVACSGNLTGGGETGGGSSDGGGGADSDGSGPGGADGAAGAGSLRIAVVSDLNDSYGVKTYGSAVHGAVDEVIALAPDVVLSTGDMVAGQMGGLDYKGMWSGFHGAVSDPLASAGIPFAVTPGNHDGSEYPDFDHEREVFINQWSARRPAVEFLDDSAYPLRYSFVLGPALFISLDATGIGPFSASERAWVADQLEGGADRPIKIVYGHVPLHSFAQGRETEVSSDDQLEAILVEHGVTLFVSGHHHAYYPGRHQGLRELSMPCLGSGPRALIGTSTTSLRGYAVLEVEDGELVSVEAYREGDWKRIGRGSLPEKVSYGGVTVKRDDL